MLPQDFTFVVNLNDGSNVTVCGQKVSMQNQVIVPSADTVTVDTLRSEVLFPLQETFDLIGIAWDIQNDVLNMACQYHIEADYGKICRTCAASICRRCRCMIGMASAT